MEDKFSTVWEAEQIIRFTETYRRLQQAPIPFREAGCLAVQFPDCMRPPVAGDLFVGRRYDSAVLFSPQPGYMGLGWCYSPSAGERLLQDAALNADTRVRLADCFAFWEEENTHSKIKAAYPPALGAALRHEDYFHEPAAGYPLYRLSGTQLDYGLLLRLGADGLRAKIRTSADTADRTAADFYAGLLEVLDIYSGICRHYRKMLSELLDASPTDADAPEWRRLLGTMERIADGPAQSFGDAIQMVLLWWFFSGSLNLARMDTYLADYLLEDLEGGRLREAEALRLLCGMWRLLAGHGRVYDTRIVIGGRGRSNPDRADRFCLLALEATRLVKEALPQLSLRIYQGMNEAVWRKALEVIGEGRTFPMLYNDDANIPAVAAAFSLPEEVAAHYCPFGCGEYVLEHLSVGTPSGLINLAKVLELTLHNGRDPQSGELLGLALGSLTDYPTFEALFAAYTKQVNYFVALLARQQELEYIHAAKQASFLCFSMLYDDCIKRGRALLDGGVRYLGGTLESYGNVNTADSLLAIRKLVYEEKSVAPEELLEALRRNFEGFEALRARLLAAPKYGNDHSEADAMLVRVHENICRTTRASVRLTGLHSYLTVIINNDANTVLGHLTGATPDGRPAGQYLANANNPQGGMDTQGLTAMLNSIVKPDISIHAGSVQNLKLSREMFCAALLAKTDALLHVYFLLGGSQLMITVLSRGDLEAAMRNPAAYRDLMVRIGGFSARFVELGRDVQLELLSRTLY